MNFELYNLFFDYLVNNYNKDVNAHYRLIVADKTDGYHAGNEGWLHANTEEEKRNLIKSAIKIHRHKGTKYAIEEIFNTLNIVGNVKEWFNYGGKPYYFKVILQIFNRSINEETETKLRALIDEYKNEMSWLEQIEFFLSSLGKEYLYSATIQKETITVNSKES